MNVLGFSIDNDAWKRHLELMVTVFDLFDRSFPDDVLSQSEQGRWARELFNIRAEKIKRGLTITSHRHERPTLGEFLALCLFGGEPRYGQENLVCPVCRSTRNSQRHADICLDQYQPPEQRAEEVGSASQAEAMKNVNDILGKRR